MAVETPGQADAIVRLLNSRPHATPVLPDRLDTADTAAEILRPFGLFAKELGGVRAVRADLMAVLEAATAAEADKAWAELSDHVAGVSHRQVFSSAGVELEQVSGDDLVGGITRAVAELVAAGQWTRVRICANDICRGVFYDTTRSRTQRWHSYELCGNKSNVAAHRARKHQETA
ncbi:CGNR zinc finger domain-containing protein [Kribbella antibiotica]|uniref:CGNR zinc finger domain-containing protein n=1 Tax=Kribbella antibiotica TaxID=190195 RepID=A0A4R4YKP5_9ACTN|nr:CGNR zinc finger domain-containing protein [Kribbella antibiotica]TDD45558.1 CGNR zinc finger domain-containing protein [Kribbella antibiotica]